MIDERHEELAALYALDLLEGAELASFESALARDPALQTLVRELRDAGAALAHTAPALTPPPALRARVLASISTSAAATPAADNVLRPPLSVFRSVFPWAAAACFALSAAWLGQLYLATRSEAARLRDGHAAAELALKSTQQQLEAERILSRRQILDTEKQAADATRLLTDTRTQLTDTRTQLADVRSQLTQRDTQLADLRSQLTNRDTQLASLTQRIDTLTGATADLGRQLGESKQRVAALTDQLRTEVNLATLKITALASMLKNSPQALAVAVWNPAKQEGILKVEKLPALATDKDYQLWVVDPQYPNPVDGGVFTVDPQTGEARIQFKSSQPVTSIAAFAVTLERKGGVKKAEGPFVLLGK